MPGPAPTMGLTLSPGLPTSLVAQAWGLGPWAPFPGLSTRLVSSWVLGSPFRPPSLLPRLLKAAAALLPSHLLPPFLGPAPTSLSPSLLYGERWEGWESNGISVGSRGEGLDSSLGRLVFLDQTQKKLTNPPSLPWLTLERLVKVNSEWRPAPTEPPGTQTTASP